MVAVAAVVWYLSPSGWPTSAETGSLFALSLDARGWTVLSADQVQPAIDAYNAGQPTPPAAVSYVTRAELVLSPTAPTSPAAGTVWINTTV